MAVTVFRSTDASAPTLSSSNGTLITVLDACLVNGYGSKAAAGWTKPYSGTQQAVYRGGSGVQHYFHVLDDASFAGNGAEARFGGSETATAFNTGTGFFPTVAQAVGGITPGNVMRKATSGGVAWIVIADDRTCYMFAQADNANWFGGAFGEFYSLLTVADLYRSMTVGRQSANNATTTLEQLDKLHGSWASAAGGYLARTYTGIGSSQVFARWGDSSRAGAATAIGAGANALAVPEPVSGAIHVAPMHISDASGTPHVRGRLRGFFQLCHNNTAFAHGDTITGSGAYSGRTFLLIKPTGNSGAYCIDITGPWETN